MISHYLIKQGDCLVSILARDIGGYTRLSKRINGERVLHRIAWVIKHGPIPKGMDILHKCDNPPCCNVKHLFLGNQTINNLDRDLKGRQAKHEKQWCTDLTMSQVERMRELYAAGFTQKHLATMYGIHQSQVSRIVRYEDWK